MLSKAAYYMQDHIRRNYALISDIAKPNVIMARGRQSFPQGLHAIAKIFSGRLPAHVYAHRYFMERQSDPSQPSPQLHITEESQGILKVMGGMRYMRDPSSALDSTVVLMTDYAVLVKGRMLCIHEEDLKAKQNAMGPLRPSPSSFTGSASSMATTTTRGGEEENGVWVDQAARSLSAGGGGTPLAPPLMRRSAGMGGGLGKGIGVGSGGFQGMMQASHGGHLGGAATEPPVFPSPDDPEDQFDDASTGNDDGDGKGKKRSSMVDPRRSYRFFHVALYPRSAPSSLHSSNFTGADGTGEETTTKKKKNRNGEEDEFTPVFQEKEGGYTVLYNPVEVSDKTFADLIHKLHVEERVVAAIVLPTRHAWRHVQLWADAFPDAKIISSGPVPIEDDGSPVTTTTQETRNEEGKGGGTGGNTSPNHTSSSFVSGASVSPGGGHRPSSPGGCEDMGGGVMGISFPEVDASELAKTAGEVMDDASPASALDGPTSFSTGIGSASVSFTNSLGNRQDEDVLVDSILLNPGEMYLKPFTGLRQADANRVTVLRPPHANTEEKNPHIEDHARSSSPTAPPTVVPLTPSLQLHYIAGDPNAEEYVLYDAQSQTLACAELYHGEYSDFDPVNSWMARVWFKFMKRGNHKRVDLVPRDKWLGIRYGNHDPQKGPVASLSLLRETIDDLTTRLPIAALVFAHGTPPLVKNPANTLRRQWGMSPMRSSSSTATTTPPHTHTNLHHGEADQMAPKKEEEKHRTSEMKPQERSKV